MVFKNLQIKLLSVALLITLISYGGNENNILPQQFTSEYVVFTKADVGATFYTTTGSVLENLTSGFAAHDLQCYLNSISSSQKVVFKINHFISQGLKDNRHFIVFQAEMSSHSEIVNRHFI
jgi:hypothetical protein